MQNCIEWKSTLRKDLYQQNLRIIITNLSRTSKKQYKKGGSNNSKQQIASQMHEYIKKGQSRSVKADECFLPSYERHPKLSFCIAIRQQVLIPSDIEYIFRESLGNGNTKSKKVEEMLRFFRVDDKQITMSQRWHFLLQKYICPIDVMERIELYVNLLKYGTQKLESFFLFKYPHLNPKVMLKSIMQMQKHFYSPKLIQFNLQIQKTKLTSYFCPYCSVYNCINHIPCYQKTNKIGSIIPIKQSQQYKQTSDYLIDSLIRLLQEIKNMHTNRNNKVKNKAKPCSSDCYRNLSYRDIQSYYRQFYLSKQFFDLAKHSTLKSIFGYNPCSIAKALQSKCNKVLIFLLLQSPNNLNNFLGVSQSERLKNIPKYEVIFRSGGCSCIKGECSTNNCECFANKRECSSQTCQCQHVLAGMFGSPQICLNQKVTSGRYTHLRVGISDRDSKSLGLFTMNAIRSQQVVFWASGKLHIENCWNDLEEWFLNRSGEKACNVIYGKCNGKTLGGKYRFICHRNPKDANLKQVARWVNGIEYTIFLASRDLKAQQELFLSCKCCLLQ